jgi:hypothetical protein
MSEEGTMATHTSEAKCLLTTTRVELTEGEHYWEMELVSKNMNMLVVGITSPTLHHQSHPSSPGPPLITRPTLHHQAHPSSPGSPVITRPTLHHQAHP